MPGAQGPVTASGADCTDNRQMTQTPRLQNRLFQYIVLYDDPVHYYESIDLRGRTEMWGPTITMEMSRRSLLRRTAGFGAGALATSLFGAGAIAAAPKFKTVEDGFITIAMSGTMPVTGVKDGQIIGSDAEMIVAIASHLGLGVKPAIMAWSATIEAIKSGRADIMCGDMGWTQARANAMLLTDAIYYDGNFVT